MSRILRRQQSAVQVLAGGGRQADAARAAGCSARTIARWLQDPEFVELVQNARSRAIDDATARLGGLALKAADTLGALLTARNSPSARLGAARAILDAVLRIETHKQTKAEPSLNVIDDTEYRAWYEALTPEQQALIDAAYEV